MLGLARQGQQGCQAMGKAEQDPNLKLAYDQITIQCLAYVAPFFPHCMQSVPDLMLSHPCSSRNLFLFILDVCMPYSTL